METNAVKLEILSQIYDVTNLTGVSFLITSGGQAKAPVFITDNDHTKGLAYIHLSCNNNAQEVDKRVFQEPLYLSFCLKSPQSSYDPPSSITKSIYTSVKPSPIVITIAPGTDLTSEIADVSDTSTTTTDTTITTPVTTPISKSYPTPKMSQLLGLHSGGNSCSIISYFGPMSILNDLKKNVCFLGGRTQLIGCNPSRLDTREVQNTLH